jgi:DNA invertase Pin-like site-specific DNA recombinase
MSRKAAQGRWVGGPQPLGYRRAPEGGRLVVDEAEAAVVRRVFDLYVNELARQIAPTRMTGNYGDQMLRHESVLRPRPTLRPAASKTMARELVVP